MEVFGNKMKDNPVLKEADSKNASDRVRSEWRFERKSNNKHEEEDDTPSSEPPIQKHTLSEKKNLIFSSAMSSCSSDVLAPSNPSFDIRNIFDEEDKFSSEGMSEYGEWKCHFANHC